MRFVFCLHKLIHSTKEGTSVVGGSSFVKGRKIPYLGTTEVHKLKISCSYFVCCELESYYLHMTEFNFKRNANTYSYMDHKQFKQFHILSPIVYAFLFHFLDILLWCIPGPTLPGWRWKITLFWHYIWKKVNLHRIQFRGPHQGSEFTSKKFGNWLSIWNN